MIWTNFGCNVIQDPIAIIKKWSLVKNSRAHHYLSCNSDGTLRGENRMLKEKKIKTKLTAIDTKTEKPGASKVKQKENPI